TGRRSNLNNRSRAVRKMAYSNAAAIAVTAWDGGAFAPPQQRATIFGGLVVGAATVAAAGLLVTSVALSAAWMIATSRSANSAIRAKVPMTLEVVALAKPYGELPAAPDSSDSLRVLMDPGYIQDAVPDAQQASGPASIASLIAVLMDPGYIQ